MDNDATVFLNIIGIAIFTAALGFMAALWVGPLIW
jgi:hypothetical protein